MSFIPFTEKKLEEKKKKLEKESDSEPDADPDPHQNDGDPKHCLCGVISDLIQIN